MIRVNVHFKNEYVHSFLVPDTETDVLAVFQPGCEVVAEVRGATMLNGAVGIAQKFYCKEILFMVAETDTGQPQQSGPVS